ncbi:MAG: hypothetical protein QGG76_01330, partial [Candidatus Thalassarchaeaceae archaeon]|nr:hypothetical protein [Candidatus Thalassarchaeaceae archaeon]
TKSRRDWMSRPIYERLAKTPKRKLDKLEYQHQQHLTRFSNSKEGKLNEVQEIDRRLDKLRSKASKELKSSVPRSLGTAMEMRHVKADLLIAKSVLAVLRSNQFYHRMMVMLIQDVKAGVEYDPTGSRTSFPWSSPSSSRARCFRPTWGTC